MSLLSDLLALALRALAALFGLVFMLGVLLLGLVAGALLLAWALLRGRRPALRFGGAPPAADVVDVEVREVRPPGPR